MPELRPPDESASEPSRHAVAFVFIVVLLDMIGFGIIIPVMPALIREVGGIGIAEASLVSGWMFFAYSATQFLFGPTVGNLSDAYGRRPLLLLAVLGLAVDYVIMALASSLWLLYAGRAFAGLCGASWVIANAYIADIREGEERTKAFAVMSAAFGLGFIIGPVIGGLLGTYGPRVPFIAAALISAVSLVYGYFVLPETLPRGKRRAFDLKRANPLGVFRVLRNYRGVVPLAAVLVVYTFASSVYPTLWAFWGTAKFGWSEATIGLTLAAFGLVTVAFQGLATGPFVKTLGERNTVLFGFVVGVIAAVGYGLAGGLAMVIVLLIVHAPEGFVGPILTAIMSGRVPEDAQGELQGAIGSLSSLAMLVGTIFFAQIFALAMVSAGPLRGPDVAYFAAAVLMALALALFVRIDAGKGASGSA